MAIPAATMTDAAIMRPEVKGWLGRCGGVVVVVALRRGDAERGPVPASRLAEDLRKLGNGAGKVAS